MLRKSTSSLFARAPLRVWDVPTRIFHWLLAGLIAFSWWSAEYDHIDWHIWSGIAILTALVFRLLWGFFGSSTARFSSFLRGPKSVVAYLRGGIWGHAGHNPLGGWSVVALLVVTSVQVGLGLISADEDGIFLGPLAHLVSSETSDTARHLHALNFDLLLVLIALHIGAILYYRLFRGRRLTSTMLTGRSWIDEPVQPMRPGKWWAALICLAAAVGIARWVVAGAPPL